MRKEKADCRYASGSAVQVIGGVGGTRERTGQDGTDNKTD